MVSFRRPEFSRIKNFVRNRQPRDFEFNLFGFLFMLLIATLGMGIQWLVFGQPELAFFARIVSGLVMVALLYSLWPSWVSLLFAPAILAASLLILSGSELLPADLSLVLGPEHAVSVLLALAAVLVAPSFLVIVQWDKVVILRLGKFRRTIGPGIHFLAPLLDRCAAFVDTRIRVTDFSAEKILTRDTVPVHIDALAFWMIWDAQKAILEVESFLEAVTLSAQTALRDSIGKYSLTTLLTERETLYREIQSILDAKTNPWGITILSVEFTDIVLPKELEESMSAMAQAEREKQSRLYLSQAEAEIASKFVDAARTYDQHPQAMNLRGMNMVFEAMKARGSLVLIPNSAVEGMNMPGIMGLTGLAKSAQAGELGQKEEDRGETADGASTEDGAGAAGGKSPQKK